MGIFGRGPTIGGRPSRQDRRRLRARRPTPARRQETERRVQLFLGAMMAIVVVAVLGLGAYGYYDANIRPKHERVLAAGEREFSLAYLERHLRYVIRTASPTDPVRYDANTALQNTVDQVLDAEMERIGAPALGISISEEEIDAEVREQLRIPAEDKDAFAAAYRKEVQDSGLKPDEYREAIAAKLRNEKLRQYFRDQVPATADQVRARVIQVGTEEEAQKVLERLGAGEDFAALAAELSLDASTKDKGGEMDWVARGGVAAEVENVLFALEAGQTSKPLEVNGKYEIYQVLEKAAAREVTPDQRALMEDRLYAEWRTEISQEHPVTTYLTTEQIQHLLQIASEEGARLSGVQP
ncbi:MAG: peptidylprolyl isomerase [Dehalococcoidia bacterium]|nr:peptidylprolyl isomerase [Dehalococcoidia bacterium]